MSEESEEIILSKFQKRNISQYILTTYYTLNNEEIQNLHVKKILDISKMFKRLLNFIVIFYFKIIKLTQETC